MLAYLFVITHLVICASADDSDLFSNRPRFMHSNLERQEPVDFLYDLAGRIRLITRNRETGQLSLYWVEEDPATKLPIIEDTKTKFPYLVKFTMVFPGELRLYRLMRGKNGIPVVVNFQTMKLFKPVFNKYNEVELLPIRESEAGFFAQDAELF